MSNVQSNPGLSRPLCQPFPTPPQRTPPTCVKNGLALAAWVDPTRAQDISHLKHQTQRHHRQFAPPDRSLSSSLPLATELDGHLPFSSSSARRRRRRPLSSPPLHPANPPFRPPEWPPTTRMTTCPRRRRATSSPSPNRAWPSTRTWVRSTSFSPSPETSLLFLFSFFASPALLSSGTQAVARREAFSGHQEAPGCRPGGVSGVDQGAGPEINTLRQEASQAIPSYLALSTTSRRAGMESRLSFRRSAFMWRGGKSPVAVARGIDPAAYTSGDLSSPFRCLVLQ